MRRSQRSVGMARLAIGLHGEAKSGPPGQRGIEVDLREHLELHVEPVLLLCIDGQWQAVRARDARQFEQLRQEFDV